MRRLTSQLSYASHASRMEPTPPQPTTPGKKRRGRPELSEEEKRAREEARRAKIRENARKARQEKADEEKKTYKSTDFSITISVIGRDISQEMVDGVKAFVNGDESEVQTCMYDLVILSPKYTILTGYARLLCVGERR